MQFSIFAYTSGRRLARSTIPRDDKTITNDGRNAERHGETAMRLLIKSGVGESG